MSAFPVYPSQLLLNLKTEQDKTFEQFIVGKNRILLDLLQNNDPYQKGYSDSIFFWSSLSNGKSHLLRGYCFYWQRRGIHVGYLDMASSLRSNFDRLLPETAMAIDNIQTFVGNAEREEELLIFLKNCYDRDILLLMSADKTPADLSYSLEELNTRLMSFYVFQVYPLGEKETRDFIRNKASKLNVNLTGETEQTLIRHCVGRDTKFIENMFKILANPAHSQKALSDRGIEELVSGMQH